MSSRLLLAGVERSLVLAINQDPLTRQRLATLQGRVILIRSREPAASIYLLPDSEGLRLASHHEAEADCILSAPASLLARLALGSDRQQLLQLPAVELSGDTQLLVQLQNIFADLQLDGEAALARWLGPVAAHAIGRLARSGRNWVAGSRGNLHRAVADYLTEEGRQLIGRAEADSTAARIHDLRLQLDRLEARVQRLLQTDTESDT